MLALSLAAGACGTSPKMESARVPAVIATTTTASTIPPRPKPRPNRGTVRLQAVVVPDDAFWRRLANCECASGRCGGRHISYFQFSPDTARKLGIDGSEPYEEQKAAAIRWLGMIGGRGGSRSGWPICWWKAAA